VWQDEHRPEAARASVARTLADLGVSRLDLLLVHWPEAWLPGSTVKEWKDDTGVTLEDTWWAGGGGGPGLRGPAGRRRVLTARVDRRPGLRNSESVAP
jgi:hypothetical protein